MIPVPELPEVIVATQTVRFDVNRIVRDLTGAGYSRDELDLPAVLAFVATWVQDERPGGSVVFTDGEGRVLEVELNEHGFLAS